MIELNRRLESILRIFLVLSIPIFLGLIAWESQATVGSKPQENQGPFQQTTQDDSTAKSGDTIVQPGSGTWQTTSSGLKYLDLIVSQGPVPKVGQKVAFLFTIRLENGKVIASSQGVEPLRYVYGYTPLPPGWMEGVSSMKVGEWRRFILPPNLAYGNSTLGGDIPPNATLVVDAQLISLDPKIVDKNSVNQ